MKRLVWVFICGVFSTILSGCGGVPASNSLSNISFDPRTVVPPSAQRTANTCAVILPENMSLISAYTGECMNGRANGNGKITVEKTYPKNAGKFILTYEGMFLNGKLTGKGKETEKFGNHWYEGTFNEWNRWTGTVHFAQTEKKKARQIYLQAGSVTSQPVDVTNDPLYYTKANNVVRKTEENTETQRALNNSECNVIPPEGRIILTPYSGDCRNGLAHGVGKVTLATDGAGEKFFVFINKAISSNINKKQGVTYEGSFQNGFFTGVGRETGEDNLYWYEGTFNKWEQWTGTVHHPYQKPVDGHTELKSFRRHGHTSTTQVDVTEDDFYFTQDKDVVAIERRPTYKNGYKPPGERKGIFAIPILGAALSGVADGLPDAGNRVGDALKDAPRNTLNRKTDEWIARQEKREREREERRKQEKLAQQEQVHVTQNVPCDRTPPSGAAPYEPGMCRDPSTGGGQISRKFLEENPQYAERVRRALAEEARLKQTAETQLQKSLSIQREISPPTSKCPSPSLLFPEMCLDAGNCDHIGSSGQIPCSSLTPAQLEELKRRGREVSIEIARRQQEYQAIQTNLVNKLRDDKERIDRGVAESARQNTLQHEAYARQQKEVAENWAAYQRKQEEDRKRFDAKQKRQQEIQTAARNAEIEKDRLAREAWEKSNREKKALAEAERQRNLIAQEELRKQQERASKGSVVNPPIQSPQGVTQQATSTPGTIPAPQQTVATYVPPAQVSSVAGQNISNTYGTKPVQNIQLATQVIVANTPKANSSPVAPTGLTQNDLRWANLLHHSVKAQVLAMPPIRIDKLRAAGQWTQVKQHLTDISAELVNNQYQGELAAEEERIWSDAWNKFQTTVETGSLVLGVGELAIASRTIYLAGRAFLEKQAAKKALSFATRGVDAAGTGGTTNIPSAAKNTEGITKSNLKLGQETHKLYRAGEHNGVTKFKEFRLPSGKRVDFLDIEKGIIYELKPNNPREIQAGKKQLQEYLNELQTMEQFKGINWKTVLDTY